MPDPEGPEMTMGHGFAAARRGNVSHNGEAKGSYYIGAILVLNYDKEWYQEKKKKKWKCSA